jgi:hypothetical protein
VQLFDVTAGEAAAVALTQDSSASLEHAGVQHYSHLTFKLATAPAAASGGRKSVPPLVVVQQLPKFLQRVVLTVVICFLAALL